MVELQVATTTGAETFLSEAVVEEFKSGLRGELLLPGDVGYDEARKVYNGMINRHPAMIVRCAGVSDVIGCVHVARDNNLLVAVKGGGHNVTGNAVCDGGIMIDLTPMKGVRVDLSARTAHAQAGLTWNEFDLETQAFGLATTGGFFSQTGIAGLTLGGGLGWLMRTHGIVCDNLLSVDMVTADGQLLTASERENQELFWGVRGGGANFGVVTSFEYRLHTVGPMVLAGMVFHPLAKAKEVLQFHREYTSMAPDEVSVAAAFMTSPDGVPLVAMVFFYNGPVEAAEEAARPLREFGPPLQDLIQPMPYRTVQTMFDAAFPSGQQNYWRSNFLKVLSDDAIDTMVEYVAAVPSPQSLVIIEQFGGAVGRVNEDQTAFSHRQWPYNFLIAAMWPDPVDNDKNIEWTRHLWEAMLPFTADRVYLNYMSEDAEDRIKASYGANYDRLVALKNKYDPTNLFRLNQNIKPTV